MNKVQMAAKMYDARDSLKSLFPDIFPERVAKIQAGIKKAMALTGKNELETMIDLMTAQSNAVAQMWIMAATTEMIEPSV